MKQLWRIARVVLVVIGAWMGWNVMTTMVGCMRDPWDVYAMDTQPDVECRVGSVGGYDLWVWKCVDGERVAISKFTGEMFSGRPHRDTGPCGERTELESEVLSGSSRRCMPGNAPAWGGGHRDGQVYERVYEPDVGVELGPHGLWQVMDAAQTKLAALDSYAALEGDGGQLYLILPAGASDAEIAEADRIVNLPPMHLVSSGIRAPRF